MPVEVIIMSIEAKATLLNSMEHELSRMITAADMSAVLTVLSDQLAEYEVQHTGTGLDQPDDLLDAYLAAMQIQGRSPKTIERYKYIILRMMAAVNVPTRQITVYHLRQYLAQEKRRGISDRTLESIRQIFSAYFNWLQRENLIETNPTANLGAVKYQKKIKKIYSEVDMEKMKFGCRSKRDFAIIAFLASTGCRVSEMTQLNRTDVNLNDLECKVVGKGNKERTVFLSPVAGMAVQEYLDSRTDDYEALFIGKGTKRLKPGGVRYMMKKLQERVHVDHIHPHKFRRTLATTLTRHDMPIQIVATILGHEKLDTTMQYVVLNKADVKNAYERYA